MAETASTASMSSPAPTGRRALQRAGIVAGGFATVLVGLALIPLPGPGTLVVFAGLTVLRKEFPSAGRAADRIKGAATTMISTVRRRSDAAGPSTDRAVAP